MGARPRAGGVLRRAGEPPRAARPVVRRAASPRPPSLPDGGPPTRVEGPRPAADGCGRGRSGRIPGGHPARPPRGARPPVGAAPVVAPVPGRAGLRRPVVPPAAPGGGWPAAGDGAAPPTPRARLAVTAP